MKNIAENVEALITPIIEGLGCEIIEVEYKKNYDAMHLTVYIDKEGGVSLDDCEKVHKAIDGPLDTLDPTAGQYYVLNVSSPGLDRPLKNLKDYKRNKDKEVEVSLFSAIDKVKKFQGIFSEWTDDTVTVIINGEPKTFNKKDISIIKPVI
jgi:ribosome maturation factor RimP